MLSSTPAHSLPCDWHGAMADCNAALALQADNTEFIFQRSVVSVRLNNYQARRHE